jgi:Family of unknown function (DUF5763)
MPPKTSSSSCQALTKKGKPCRAAATEGGLCFFHANPNKAVELGRIGGKKNGHLRVGLDPLPNLDNAMAIRGTVARLISDVYEGKLHPRIAAGLARLMHLQLRAVEKTELEKRLAKLERLVRDAFLEDEERAKPVLNKPGGD